MEFRDTEFETISDFLSSDWYKNGRMTEKRFRDRNPYDLVDMWSLSNLGLIETNFDAWHQTYLVTDKGKEAIRQIEAQTQTV